MRIMNQSETRCCFVILLLSGALFLAHRLLAQEPDEAADHNAIVNGDSNKIPAPMSVHGVTQGDCQSLGAKAFIVEALRMSIFSSCDVLLAAHPLAPLADYPRSIVDHLKQGYL